MSTRLYPLFQRGNPQRRVFLTNFNVFCVRPSTPQPDNVVTFHCSMKMTKYDIHNYLTKIYKLPVADIKLDVVMGEFTRAAPTGYIIKAEDVKVAYVTLGENQTFEFPNIFPSEKVNKDMKQTEDVQRVKDDYKSKTVREDDRPSIPSWFGL
uniref:Large ribosomal subunit protein uL23m n=2 Tax=Hirondellea gigas TaxID=1518452 RepID=A0A2P2I403_9CRUS